MEWLFRDISVRVEIGPYNDKELGLVVKARNIPLGLELGGVAVTANEASEAENVEYWPSLSLGNTSRRSVIFHAASEALQKTELLSKTSIGFFTMGLEVARIPTWEIAEEIVKALHTHCQKDCGIDKVVIVASTPTQVSSLQYALDNVHIIV
ncbi:MAG: hypothetical protein P1Q69_19410 [Candidatus Thorarchaeota archaeon]|nr:hypothetical protein [Candidatus Thorarchaeota archaeon]